MIVAEQDGRFQFTTQPAHAELAGRLADRWGNDRVAAPAPTVPLRLAAYHHDVGWRGHDDRPHVDAAGEPVDFRSADPATWADLYEAGIDHVAELDAYAGLLCSLHGAGLRRRRYGLSPSWSQTPPAYAEFVDREERRQERLADRSHAADRLTDRDRAQLRHLHATGDGTDGPGGRLWTGYRLLQAWDTLSLALCLAVEPPAIEAVEPVPTGDGDVTLTLDRVENGVRVDPYPFATAPLTVPVTTRTVEQAAFADAPLEAYYGAPQDTKTIRLVR